MGFRVDHTIAISPVSHQDDNVDDDGEGDDDDDDVYDGKGDGS